MTIILFILLLMLIIVIHEAGHLIAAKIFGVYCYEFSFGMGPLLFSKKKKETKYCLRALPIGGYVMMAGDNEEVPEEYKDVEIPSERTLANQPTIKKLIIMFAGIFMNIILAFVISSMIILGNGYYAESADNSINSVLANSPAESAGLKANDKIVRIELQDHSTYKITEFDDLGMYMSMYDGTGNIILTVERNDEKLDITVTPKYSEENNSYMIGIQANEAKVHETNILNCWKYGFKYLLTLTISIFDSLFNLFRGIGLNNLSGPVGVYSVTKEVVSQGFTMYMNLVAILSINVGIFNLIPIPALDGGRMLITLIEAIVGKPLSKKVTNTIMIASIVILLMIFALSTFNDISKLF